MWVVAVYLVDRIRGTARTWRYDQFRHAEAKALHIREHGFALEEDDGAWLHYGAHRVEYVAIRKDHLRHG